MRNCQLGRQTDVRVARHTDLRMAFALTGPSHIDLLRGLASGLRFTG